MRIDGPGLIRLLEQAASVEAFEESVSRHYFAGPSVRDVVDFLEVPAVSAFDLPPQKAIEFFKAKRLRATFSYADMIGDAHAQAFTVAKMMDVDLLGQMRASLDDALANGTPFKEWADSIMPRLQAAGWWGRKEVVDPVTGQTIVARLGTPSRLETIFRTNLQSAYAAGQWSEIQRNADIAPFLMYDAVDDFRTRELHRQWDQTVLPVNDAWWTSHYPPNGYNCRCGVIQLDAEEVEALGLNVAIEAPNDGLYKWTNPRTGDVFYVPEGIDPGFDWSVGRTAAMLSKTLDEKIDALPDTAREAAKKAAVDMRKQIAATKAAQEEVDAASDVARAATIEAQNRANATADAAIARAKAIAEQKAKEAAAAAQLQAIKTGKGGAGIYGKNAYAALMKVPGFASGTAAEQLPVVLAKAKQLAEAAQIAKALAGFEKNILAGKTPTKAQAAAAKNLPQADQDAFLASIAKKKADAELAKQAAAAKAAEEAAQAAAAAKAAEDAAAAAAAPKPTPAVGNVIAQGSAPDPRRLVKVGPQRGSNEGGEYLDESTGARWYVKFPGNEDIARNEVLAAKLYELAGVDVPELHLIDFGGRRAIASKIVDGVTKTDAVSLSRLSGAFEGFAVDAWLANWDAVGLGFDNLLARGAKAIRIDVGGSLRYRAQGGLKGSAFDSRVSEWDSLRNSGTNPQSAAVFGRMTPAQLEASAARVIALSDDDIRAIVERYGPADATTRRELADLLIARKASIARRYPKAAEPEPPAPVADGGERVTTVEQRAIEAARVNGYAIRTDGPDIEDHNVVVSTAVKVDGSDMTRGWMKIRPDAQKRLLAEIRKVAGDAAPAASPAVPLSGLSNAVLTWAKGVNSRTAKGSPLESKDIDRAGAAITEIKAARTKLGLAKLDADADSVLLLDAREKTLAEWQARIEAFLSTTKAGDTLPAKIPDWPSQDFPPSLSFKRKVAPAAPAERNAIQWLRRSGFEYETATFKKSLAKFTGGRANVDLVSESFEAALPGGVRVKFIPAEKNGRAYALHGVLQIDVDGKGIDKTKAIFETLDKLGIDSKRASDVDRAHYYLNAFARLRFTDPANKADALRVWRATLEGLKDEASIQKKIDFIRGAIGVDVSKSRGWANRAGVYQAFGHGRTQILRPDLDTPEFDKLENDAYLYHNPNSLSKDGAGMGVWVKVRTIIEGGGQFAAASDRIRRGVPLSTHNKEDIPGGGGDYHFTRIKSRSRAMGSGIYWRLRQIKRLDAITYKSDNFGKTKDGNIEEERRGQTVESLRSMTSQSSDETIFKAGLSIFDDVEYIVLENQTEVEAALREIRELGYREWPDGRRLEDVIVAKASVGRKRPQ